MKTKKLLFTTIAFCLLLFNTVMVKAQPGSFSLLLPTNGGYVNTLPNFDWANSTSASYYQLYIDGTLKKDNIATSNYQLITGQELTQGMQIGRAHV